jgi:hypothetical protein
MNGIALNEPFNQPLAEDDELEDEASLRPALDIGSDLHNLVDRALQFVARDEFLFQTSTELVQLSRDHDHRLTLCPLKGAQLRYLLAKHIRWMKDDKPCHPPSAVATCILERGSREHVRPIRAVLPFPVLSPRGVLQPAGGYDAATRTFCALGEPVDVPEQPTREDAQRAIGELLDVVQDFPFADDAHRAAWLAALLTPLSRFAHDGNVPLILVQANAPRVGKTRLVQVISEILMGTDAPVITQTRSEDETRKRAMTFLRTARPIVLIDNVLGLFGGATLNALATSRTFEDRVLGSSKTMLAENLSTWFITGNNVSLAADTPERCLHIRLHTEAESPQLRSGFRYPDLFAVVRERRVALLSAALTILRAYFVAGLPDQGLPAWGSFESWSRLVRGALVWAGASDPAATREELEANSDAETDVKAMLIAGWEELQEAQHSPQGFRAAEVLALMKGSADKAPTLRAALSELATAPLTVPEPKTLARHLRDAKGRNFRGRILRCDPDLKAAHRWRVERVSGEQR